MTHEIHINFLRNTLKAIKNNTEALLTFFCHVVINH